MLNGKKMLNGRHKFELVGGQGFPTIPAVCLVLIPNAYGP